MPKARLTEVEDNVEVYTSEVLPPEVARNTGLHRDPKVEFRYTTYYYGTNLSLFQRDLQKLLREQTDIPYLAVDTYYIRPNLEKVVKEQTTIPEEMKLLPNAKQNLYWWTVEQLREECIRQGLIEPTKRYHKKELIDFLEPGLGLRPPYARKIGQVWDPEKHIWIDA